MRNKILIGILLLGLVFITGCTNTSPEMKVPLDMIKDNISCSTFCISSYDNGGLDLTYGVEECDWCVCYGGKQKDNCNKCT